MRAENGDCAVGDLIDLFHKDNAFFRKGVDDVLVVHDLFPYVDGARVQTQGHVDDINGPVHARTEASRLGQPDSFWLHRTLATSSGKRNRI